MVMHSYFCLLCVCKMGVKQYQTRVWVCCINLAVLQMVMQCDRLTRESVLYQNYFLK